MPFLNWIGYCIFERGIPFQTLCCVWKGISTAVAFHLSMPFLALPNPNMIWQIIEGHALPNTSTYRNVWKGMPFFALPYHIGVWKGMEGHRYMEGHRSRHALPKHEIMFGRAFYKGTACPSKHDIMFGRACPFQRYNILLSFGRAI